MDLEAAGGSREPDTEGAIAAESAGLLTLSEGEMAALLSDPSDRDPEAPPALSESLTAFSNHFVGYMDLYADSDTVIDYLNAHRGWFCRCAAPLQAEPIDTNAYALGIGRIGALGFEVDARIGLDLLPQDKGLYRIRTVPLPDRAPQPYAVDFQAVMELLSQPRHEDYREVSAAMTSVSWSLDLVVTLQFPKFILSLPRPLIQKTGDALLAHVVRTVSNRLTAKVQEDFHRMVGVKVPKHLLRR